MIPLDLILLKDVLTWAVKTKYSKYFKYCKNVEEKENETSEFSVMSDFYHTAVVTCITDNIAYIGEKYFFDTSKVNNDVYVGSIVTCIINDERPSCVGDVTVIDIWNSDDEENQQQKGDTKRGVIVKREGRIFFVSPGPVCFDLDNVVSNFIPEVDDVVEMVVQTDIIDGAVNTNVVSICPKGYKTVYGTVTSFEEGSGFIDDTVLFKIHHCKPGYVPCKDDKVVFSIIRCQSGNIRYRAVYINPIKTESNMLLFEAYVNDITFYPREIIHVKVGEKKIIETRLFNHSSSTYKLLSLTAHTNETSLKMIEPTDVKMIIHPKESKTFVFEIQLKFIGFSNIAFDFIFEDYIFNCDLKLIAMPDTLSNSSSECKESKIEISTKPMKARRTENHLSLVDAQSLKGIPGRKFFKSCNFIPVKMGLFNVPKDLLELFDSSSNEVTLNNIKTLVPCLQNGLQPNNYKIFFHTLLYLEEIKLLETISKLESISGFMQNGDFLTLFIEEETNFSLLQSGDRVYARKPWEDENRVYEGIIWVSQPGELSIKFDQAFHTNYIPNSEYILTFSIGRTTFRFKHQAVEDACYYMKTEWLFPEKVSFKPPIVTSVSDESEESIVQKFPSKNKKVSWNRQGSGYGNRQVNSVMDSSIPLNRRRKIQWFNIELNEEQKAVVTNVLQGVCRPLPYVIFGPPGTGKSYTLIEIILQVYNLVPESKLLISAPSNSAADLLCLGLISSDFINKNDIVRLCGHKYSSSSHIPKGLVDHVAVAEFREEVLSQSEFEVAKINRYQLAEKRVIVGTLSSLGVLRSMGFPRGYFSHFFIDEAAQVVEPESLILVGLMSKDCQLILAGDPLQLGPVIVSKFASRYGLGKSLMERFMEYGPYLCDKIGFPNTYGFNPKFITKLIKSYRCLPDLLSVSNKLFYHNELHSMIDNNSSREASIYKTVKEIFPKGSVTPMLFHSIKGQEILEPGTFSFYNLEEVFQVCSYISKLYKCGISAANIGVITPYLAHAKKIITYLENLKCEMPKVGSVEEFQGQERDVIILSTVRSSPDNSDNNQNFSFIYNAKRVNVALTRSKAVLIIVGNYSTLNTDKIWNYVISFCADKNSFLF